MSALSDLPPQFLLGLRDALSSALNVSITFFDNEGKETGASRYHVGRRFTLDVCQLYHCAENSPVKVAVCDVWDREAKNAIDTGERTFDRRCGLGYNCFAVAIRHEAASHGFMTAGERRLVGDDAKPFLERSLRLLSLPAEEQASYVKKWDASRSEPFEVTQLQWADITTKVTIFARFVALCIEHWDPDIKRWSSIKAELLRTTPRVRAVVDTVLGHMTSEERDSILSILAAGFPASNQWLWDFHDPDVMDPAHSKRRDRDAFVIFADIRDYTPMFEALGPGIIEPRRRIFQNALGIIKDHGGVVDKFLGDAILAYFFIRHATLIDDNLESGEFETAVRAAGAATALQELVERTDTHSIRFGIGMAFGSMHFGHFYYEKGTWSRREITGVGSVINRAARLCSLARKRTAVGETPAVVVGDDVKRWLHSSRKPDRRFSCAYIDSVRLKGLGDRKYFPIYALQTTSSDTPVVKRVVLSYGFVSSPPTAVADAITDYYEYLKLGKHDPPLGIPAYALPGEIASIMECPDTRITFRASTTDCIEDAVDAFIEHLTMHRDPPLARRKLVVMATDAEHPALDEVLALRFEKVSRIQIREMKCASELDISTAFAKALGRIRPDLVVFPHIVWSSGLRLPFRRLVREIRDKFEKKQPTILVDGAHALGHVRLQIAPGEDPLDTVDFYTTCGHKWLRGPHGVGVMYVGPKVTECGACERRLAFGDMFTRLGGLGSRASSHQVRTQDRAKAYAFLAAVRDFKDRRSGRSVGEALDADLDIIKVTRERFLATLRGRLGDALVEFTPSPSVDTVSGILAFAITGADDQLYERAKRRLERAGILVDILTRGREIGIRVCLSSDLDVAELDGVVQKVAEALG